MMYTVKLARVASGLTQRQMAEKMGVSRDTYRKIELNPDSATIAQAKQVAAITNIPIDTIFHCSGNFFTPEGDTK